MYYYTVFILAKLQCGTVRYGTVQFASYGAARVYITSWAGDALSARASRSETQAWKNVLFWLAMAVLLVALRQTTTLRCVDYEDFESDGSLSISGVGRG